jgi:hypothetical protein
VEQNLDHRIVFDIAQLLLIIAGFLAGMVLKADTNLLYNFKRWRIKRGARVRRAQLMINLLILLVD